MIMLGCHFMLDVPMADGSQRTLKDAVPFREVYIHALVRDADRQKMSKTKGNVIDPIEIVERYGTDAVRFTLAAMASPGTDIAFSEARTEGYRAFANKIWNAARFIFMNVDRAAEAGIVVHPKTLVNSFGPDENAPIEAHWIVSRLNSTAAEVNKALGEYRFHEAASLVYQFFWGDFCDWYLEIVKLRLDFSGSANQQASKSALTTLLSTFEAALRLLSPFMPFLTEELWHAVYDGRTPAKSIALTRYPQPMEEALNAAVEADMALLQELIVTIRAHRKALGIEENVSVVVNISGTDQARAVFRQNDDIIQKLAKVVTPEYLVNRLEGVGVRATASFEEQLIYEKKIDPFTERERLRKKLEQYDKVLLNAERQLENEAFLAKAPEKVVSGLKKQASEAAMLRQETLDAITKLEQLA
jgi:valyl-tRNA synthetase